MSENADGDEVMEVPGEEAMEDPADKNQEGKEDKSQPAKRKKITRRSVAYDYFTQDPKTEKWKCNHCNTKLTDPKCGGTGSMVNHLKKHQNKYKEFLQRKQASETKNLNNYVTVTKIPASTTPKFSPDDFKMKILKFIVNTDQSFSLVEDEDFKELIRYIANPEDAVQIPNRKAIRVAIQEAYNAQLDTIKTTLSSESKVSFSVDCWTSRNGHAFQGVVAHWITKDWELKAIVLDLSIIEGSHSGANLAESFGNVLTRFGLWNKLFAVTSDNASNMTTFLKTLESIARENGGQFKFKDYRVRCMAHILHLSCQEVIKNLYGRQLTDIDAESTDSGDETENPEENLSFVEKIRRSSAGIRSSPQRREQLAKQCVVEGLEFKNAILDVRTRWNSTYDMLERALEIRKPLALTVQSFKQLEYLQLTNDEWNKVQATINLLKPFKEATKELSEEGVPKLSQTVSIYNALFEHLEKYAITRNTEYRDGRQGQNLESNSWIQSAVNAGWTKLMEYYPTSDGLVFVVATVLDPRYKLQWYHLAGWKKTWINNCNTMIRRVWNANYKSSPDNSSSNEGSEESENKTTGLKGAILQKFKAIREENPVDELSRYLSEHTEGYEAIQKLSEENGGRDGVLCWWKNNRNTFPQLSKMARDFLAVPATGVPVERLFSTASDLLSCKRQCLSAQTIRECICLKNWFKKFDSDFIMQAVQAKALGE